jgi:putative ABC transport system substrate-binding protein
LPRDDSEALRLYQRAAEQGNAAARNNLGRFYEFGRGGLTRDDREAARLYKLAADQGHEWAQVNLGSFYETRRGGLPLDEAEAARLYRLAAERGHPTARNKLAMFYESGRGGLPKDISEATRLYQLAAEQDRDPDAKLWASGALTRLTASTAAPSPSVLALPLVSFLSLGNGVPTPAFHQGLAEAGFVEGKNVRFEFRASPSNDQLPVLAAELINSRPSVIVATNSPIAVLAARGATSTVPIVFTSSVDPVAYGFVENLRRPGGNLTGVSLLSSELIAKRLSLLLEAAPDARTIAYLTVGPISPIYKDLRDRTVAAGRVLRREIIVLEVNSTRDLQPAFATLAEQGAGALMVGSFTNFIPMQEKIVALAQHYKVPAMYPSPIYTRAGGLMSYTADPSETDRLLGYQYVGRLLKGMKPSDLPVQQPTKFNFVLNLNTAKGLGLEIPRRLLAFADELIE